MAQEKDAANGTADAAECSQCDLAVYCYAEPSSWIFRTQAEMAEKIARMERCPVNVQGKGVRSAAKEPS
ncbi:hypothetical protein SAMN02746041_02817 [Desulfacinum hydrothermale DSM 13146]|uniref:Uncharacterized protein n=1 Tax=Desulfacinum hydrothermale DSM 13146 TaxID=1121390 RepID=A0A1W1XSJ0_9BACT|nr:hypothetical protein [Desulfacinum hydrothermale]SMC26930.1 hypothetical protein SAMN02746041_02817 [Desulfacinum hydrothermale DSM 13146]